MNSFIKESKRYFFSWGMLLSVLLGCVMLFQPDFTDFYANIVNHAEKTNYLYYIVISHSFGVFDLFAPTLVVLPAVMSFCDDYNSGYFKFIIMRESISKYTFGKICACSIIGGLAAAIPEIILTIAALINGIPYRETDIMKGSQTLMQYTIFENIQFVWGGIFLALILIGLGFLFGLVWTSIGLCISAFCPNRYVALAAPFILYFTIFIVFYRIDGLLILSPVNMLFPDISIMPSLLYVIIYQFVLFLISSLLFFFKVKRRIHSA